MTKIEYTHEVITSNFNTSILIKILGQKLHLNLTREFVQDVQAQTGFLAEDLIKNQIDSVVDDFLKSGKNDYLSDILCNDCFSEMFYDYSN